MNFKQIIKRLFNYFMAKTNIYSKVNFTTLKKKLGSIMQYLQSEPVNDDILTDDIDWKINQKGGVNPSIVSTLEKKIETQLNTVDTCSKILKVIFEKEGLSDLVKNSIENKVPFSDNRHSKMKDILAVFFAVMTVPFLTFSLLNSDLLIVSIATLFLWFICRISLNITFFKSGDVFFFIRTLLLMFCLDLIRFTCVIIGFMKNKLLKLSTKEEIFVTSIPTQS